MRGLHSTLAMEAGMSAHAVATSMGHESAKTTLELRQSSWRGGRSDEEGDGVAPGGIPQGWHSPEYRSAIVPKKEKRRLAAANSLTILWS